MVNEKKIIKEWAATLKALKGQICEDYRVEGQEDETPTMQVTFGLESNDEGGSWSYQTGDNSFTGGAYCFQAWGIVHLNRRSNSRELALYAMNQAMEQLEA